MNVKRMEKLAEKLETIKPKGFYMGAWMLGGNWGEDHIKELKQAQKNDFECGMAACVGGWAAVVFPKHLVMNKRFPATRDGKYTQAEAIASVLGLCYEHASNLTASDAPHGTPKKAAKFIRKLIKLNPECCR